MRTLLAAAALTAAMFSAAPAFADSTDGADEQYWQSLRKDVFGTRELLDGANMFALEAPGRAEDAAVVPLSVKLPATFAKDVTKLTLIIDKNPSPVVGTFEYGPAAGKGDRMLSTRVRMDQYSEVRAIAETSDGKLYMVSKFVKASGGCSAPASKDAEEAAKSLGKMQIKTAIGKSSSGLTPEAQIAIKHPNTTGMQMDQLSRAYAPARFINKIEVKTGANVVFKVEGGISFSEDPSIRFSYDGNPSDPMEVTAEDSDGTKFAGRSAASPS
ncbi:MAG TPA: quinoprotein dehydrogenase-associated SoxYZ-like carrier [Hyphomicrobium sp.]|nr:quinoprotein dehydrogenase-associated SoxYZ-like carrier [Hyphomicrobium sp.]